MLTRTQQRRIPVGRTRAQPQREARVNAQVNPPSQAATVNAQSKIFSEVQADSLLGNDRTYATVIPGDNSERKPRIMQTLDGTPNKGTVVVAVRGTADAEDLAVDRAAFGASSPPNLSGNAFYQKIKTHVDWILRRDFKPIGTNDAYSSYWDVFATGHSLGGAIADQLIMDGVAKGGMTFAPPRTRDSRQARPSYSTMNHDDRVIGNFTTEVYDSKYDKMTKESFGFFNTNHGLKEQGKIQASDGGPIYNGDYFNATLPNTMDHNRESQNFPLDGSGAAPKPDIMRNLASNAYGPAKGVYRQTPRLFATEGLEIPSYRAYKQGGAIYVQFYIISTPKDFIKFYEMPVYRVIKSQQRALADIDVDAYARARRDLPQIYI